MEKLIERSFLHAIPPEKTPGTDSYMRYDINYCTNWKQNTYATKQDCIEAGDISASPELFCN